ncbi:MAG: nucleotidyltransferase family protein [Hyphomicrobium zavarzinii]|uniref:nucleotidyltransferase family protein n=1 Tax=Hyphomicrobium zavarzinii TaxID=48292 RepID=UPI001A4A1BAD|nr:nucleotidyltransferase family protein [Hyphomicrobium zavarzinii]MBL8847683.1 nucleotidyltransferase family protein [Hyphomicrobium zavarzinii]
MVLAAGLGKRMRPLTDVVPKPLVRLKSKPLIDHVLDRLAAGGIKRAVVNVHYLPDLIEAHLASRTNPGIIISDERDALLDTGGGVVRALPLLGDAPFLIHNSDSVWIEGVGSNIARLIQAFDPDRMDSLMLLALGATSLGYDGHGDFAMDADGVLSRRGERREAPFVFTGVSIAHPRLFEDAPKGAFSLNTLWDRAIDRGRLFGLRLEGAWMHVGTPQSVEEAERWIDRAASA